MPIISVIIPVYNGEKTITSTIKSVLSQTLSDIELIIINDGSKDSTLEIIKNIYDFRLRVFSYPNAGQAVSRNRGLSLASGEYISFIDADDLWTTEKLEAQLKALQDNPQASVAYSWTNYIDEQGNFLVSGTHTIENGNVYEKLLVSNFIENGSNPLIHRQALVEVGGFDASMTPAEDWDLWLRLASRYSFVGVPSPQILYRVSATSASANLFKMETACLQVINSACVQTSESVTILKAHSMANLYKYLTCKALQEPLNRKKGLAAAKFLAKFFINDFFRLQRLNFTLKLVFKVFVILILPSTMSTTLLSSIKIAAKR
ncbi:glycosyl transferase family A [Nostoc sp. T09]|uniref:glycosyltransferase n=1 Tax=Nostoc sp. T09 TaxID=1932621 RepID=UPI000A3AE98D|nr:glycosyltransferase [Nostoc sp. T09]OUL37626.1 glycosyl transferase family A [Nostoc sp. T09]